MPLFKIVKEYWTGTRMTEARKLSYDDALHKALYLAKTRSLSLAASTVSQGTNGYKVEFPLDGRMVTDVCYIVEPDDDWS